MPALKNTFFFILDSFRGSLSPNGTRFSRREASAASEAVGWKRRLASAPLLKTHRYLLFCEAHAPTVQALRTMPTTHYFQHAP
jgi:hypothetical protein